MFYSQTFHCNYSMAYVCHHGTCDANRGVSEIYTFKSEKCQGKRILGDLVVDGSEGLILKCIVEGKSAEEWTGFDCSGTEFSGGLL
jgi:hypothetical protein